MNKPKDIIAAELVRAIINNEGILNEEVVETSVRKTNIYNRYKVDITYRTEFTSEFTLRARVHFDNITPRVFVDIYETKGEPEMRCMEISDGDIIDEYTGEVLAKTK